jgi:hypothetical protein
LATQPFFNGLLVLVGQEMTLEPVQAKDIAADALARLGLDGLSPDSVLSGRIG